MSKRADCGMAGYAQDSAGAVAYEFAAKNAELRDLRAPP